MARIYSLVLFFFLLNLVSCSSDSGLKFRRRLITKELATLTSEEEKEISKEAMYYWKNRQKKMDLVKSLALFEKLVEGSQDHYQYLIYLTRGYYFLADAHYQNPVLKRKYWEIGSAYGEQGLATNEYFQEVIKKGKKQENFLDALTKKEAPALYWTAVNLGKWSKITGITMTLNYRDKIKSYIERVEELEPDYFHGAIDRYWGGYYAVAPTFAGGSLQKSQDHFLKSIKEAPYYLGTKVLYAYLYARKKGDRKLFVRLLKEVIKANPDHYLVGPENMVEQQKAKRLLSQVDQIFNKD